MKLPSKAAVIESAIKTCKIRMRGLPKTKKAAMRRQVARDYAGTFPFLTYEYILSILILHCPLR